MTATAAVETAPDLAPEPTTPEAPDLALPGVGVYPGMSEATYHALPRQYASNSRLSRLLRSAAHLKAYLDGAREDSPALRLGSAIHCAILEPDTCASRYGVAPEGLDRRTKEGKALWAELSLQYGPDRLLKEDEHRTCLAVRDAVHAQPMAHRLLDTHHRELTIIGDADGLLVKSRLDGYNAGLETIVDIKTTTDARRDAFERAIFAHGYHRQAALYQRMAESHHLPAKHFVIIAVEKEPPYGVALYRVTEGAMDAGWSQLEPLIAKYRECLATDTWPGYPEAIADIALPNYAWSLIDASLGGDA